METSSIIAVANTAIGTAELTFKGWGRIKRWWCGNISIAPPPSFVEPEWVHLHGSHSRPNGIFWLVTYWGDQVWPQCRIMLRPDGSWAERINVNDDTKPRKCYVLLVRTTDLLDAWFRDYKKRGNKTGFWGALELKMADLDIVQELILNVAVNPILARTN